MTTYAINNEFNGIEITFSEKPEREVLGKLKEVGFRWHNAKKLWYAKNTPERMSFAEKIANGKEVKAETKKKETKEKVNKFGVKVGDLFSASWGYDQTNNDFFQVIELVGESSVRVREVVPNLLQATAVSGMSEDRVFENTKELLPPARCSVFIKDQEKGDLKRLKSYAADGKSNPQFSLSSFCNAHYCSGETIEVYESWYY